MTCRALRIYRSATPSMVGARVLPMSDENQRFWRLLAARRIEAAKRPRPERARFTRAGFGEADAPKPSFFSNLLKSFRHDQTR